MKLLRIVRTQIFFLVFLIYVSAVSRSDSNIIYASLAFFTHGFCVIMKVMVRQKKYSSQARIIAQLILKMTVIILLCINYSDTESEEFNYFRSMKYTLLGLEIKSSVKKYRRKKKQKKIIHQFLLIFTSIVFSAGQITWFQRHSNGWICFILVLFVWGFEVVRLQQNDPSDSTADLMSPVGEKQQEPNLYEGKQEQILEQTPSQTQKRLYRQQTQMFPKRISTIGRCDVELYRLKRDPQDGIVFTDVKGMKNSWHLDQSARNSGVQQNSLNEIIENQKNFYQMLFNQFPDGMIIVGEGRKVAFCNINMRKMLGSQSRDQALTKLLLLKNCQKKFAEQAQFQNLFKIFKNKLNMQQGDPSQIDQIDNIIYESDSDNDSKESMNDEMQDINIQFSDKSTILDEYSYAMSKIQGLLINNQTISSQNFQYGSGFVSGSNKEMKDSVASPAMSIKHTNDRLKFFYEVKMLCFDSENGEDEQDFEFQKQGSGQSGVKSKLFEVTIKSYVYENKPNVLIMLKDVTLFNQYSVLEQTNSNKSKMLYQVAHEFRTPLSCVILIAESLLDKFSEDQELCYQYFSPILTSASQLLSLVNDLLDLAQLKAGKFKLSYQEFDFLQLLYTISQMLAPSVSSKGLELKLLGDRRIPTIIKSDPNRIRQIIINLISNSIKFTNKGEITLEARYKEKNIIQVKVTDTGIGIEKGELPNLFRAFGKIEGTNHMNHQGVGLGLMISHILAQKLSVKPTTSDSNLGTGLQVFSEGKGHGTTFMFEIFNSKDEAEGNITPSVLLNNLVSISEDKSRSLLFEKPPESNISILYVDQKEQSSLGSRLLVGNPKKVGVHSSQRLLTDSQIVFTFHIKSDKKISSVDSKPNHNSPKLASRQFLDVRHTKTRFLSLNLGDGDTQLIKIDVKASDQSTMLPNIMGERPEEFSPKGLELELTMDTPYYFKTCNCAEILIVDDQMFNINAIKLSLKRYKLKLIHATSCEEAIDKLQKIAYQSCCSWVRLILMDVEMDGADGIQTTHQVRKLEAQRKVIQPDFQPSYIIGLSGYGDQLKEKCIKSGMDDYFVKPLNVKNFLLIIKHLKQMSNQTLD